MDLEGAIALMERANKLHPNQMFYLAMLSKCYTDMSFIDGVTKEKAREYNEKALKIGERMVNLNPADANGYIALAVSKGRLAYFSDNRSKIELAKEAEECVRNALIRNPKSDIAHHLIGRFQYEMAGLNVFFRAVARVVYGAKLSPGSYPQALEAFERANRLRPDRAIHKVCMGKTYLKLGQKQEAIEFLKVCILCEV